MGHKKLVTSNPADQYPDFLKKTLPVTDTNASYPILIDPSTKSGLDSLKKLIDDKKVASLIDNYAEQYAELLLSKNAHLYQANYDVQVSSIKKFLKEHYGDKKDWQLGTWVFYSWSRELVHLLGKEDFEDLRTIRNRDLITKNEQKKLFDFDVACFGMSVGSASALALTIGGISRKIKLIDGAVISGSNLNRILTGISDVGKNKSVAIGQKLYEMNPYIKVEYFNKADNNNIKAIFDKPWPVKMVIDEIDDLEMKIKIRVEARKRRIPVLMATELGDTVMLDVERYDLEPERPVLHDLVPGIEEALNKKLENQREWMKKAVAIIGPLNMPIKMQESLLKIGSTIVTHPQLGSTVMMTGGVVAFAVKNIALGNKIDSGRYVISLESQILADSKTRTYKRAHRKHTKIIIKAINSM